MRPDLTRVGNWYHGYINQVQETDINDALKSHTKSFIAFLDSIPKDKRDYRYAENKWTIREVLQHIIDAERVFAYRALCFARRDATPLPGFDENIFAANAKADKRKWIDLLQEFKTVRKSTRILFNSFDEEQLESNGTASNSPSYVLAVGYTLLGHAKHHQNILEERYL